MVTTEMQPTVSVDFMREALLAFYGSAQRQGYKRGWSGKAGDAVFKIVQGEGLTNAISYLRRCHAFRNMTNKHMPKSLLKWVLPDGTLDDVLIAAIALSALPADGKFRIKEFEATAARIAKATAFNFGSSAATL
jgi:hypothetical protein